MAGPAVHLPPALPRPTRRAKGRWTVKPQRKPKTPETHKAALVSGRRMSAAELAECRAEIAAGLWGDQTPTPTPQHCADTFEQHAKRIREIVHQFAYSPDARSLAAHFDTWHSAVGFACDFTRKYLKNCPALPEVPDLSGNDYYAGIIRLADCCKSAADALDGRKAQDGAGGKAETPTGNGNADRISTKEAIQGWHTSRATLKRYREEGKLTGYRPPDAPDNAPYSYAAADLDNHFTRRKRPLGGPRA